MKDVLEYTDDELNAMTVEELSVLYKEAENKESLYNTRQLVEKVLINSLYGALANKYFPLFNEDIAAAITGNGRYFIRLLARNINTKLDALFPTKDEYVLYSDTDSVYYTINPFMERYKEMNPDLTMTQYVDWADSFENKIIQPVIKDTIVQFANELNAFDIDAIGADREIIADVAIFSAKKKYLARVRDSEGTRFSENDPKIKVMGFEIAKSSTPLWAKKKLKEAIPHIFDKDENELKAWLNSIKSEFTNQSLLSISGVGGVSSLDYTLNSKGIPIGSRAALVHNRYIKDNTLSNIYSPINPGDKTYRLYLVTPNKFNSDIIAYTNEQFTKEIEGLVDYDTNFEKFFLKPLQLMVETLDYNLFKNTISLEDW